MQISRTLVRVLAASIATIALAFTGVGVADAAPAGHSHVNRTLDTSWG